MFLLHFTHHRVIVVEPLFRLFKHTMRRSLCMLARGGEAYTVEVKTPFYEFRQFKENGQAQYYCRQSNRTFLSPKEFLTHSATLEGERAPEDVRFEKAAQQFAASEPVTPAVTAVTPPVAPPVTPAVAPAVTPAVTAAPSTPKQERATLPPAAPADRSSLPPGYKLHTSVKSPDVELQYLVDAKHGKDEIMRLFISTRPRPVTGAAQIRQSIRNLTFNSKETTAFLRCLATYIPAAPRAGYTLGNAVLLVARKTQSVGTYVDLHGKTETQVPDFQRATSYITGSTGEKLTLTKVEALSTELPADIPRMYASESTRDASWVEQCYMSGTESSPVVETPDGAIPLHEFVALTNTITYAFIIPPFVFPEKKYPHTHRHQSPFVSAARETYIAI